MKKYLKIILIIFIIVIILITSDLISIFTRNKPIFAIEGNTPYQYLGLFYDTYNCPQYPMIQIKAKGNKFTCHENQNDNLIYGIITEIKDNYLIIKGTKDRNNLKTDEIAHISLNNNPMINVETKLSIGDKIKLEPSKIQETYPITIETKEIIVIN